MMEKIFQPEVLIVLALSLATWEISSTLITRWWRPWREEMHQAMLERLEAQENARWAAQALKTWAEQNVNPKMLDEFLSLSIGDQRRIKNEIIQKQERRLAEARHTCHALRKR